MHPEMTNPIRRRLTTPQASFLRSLKAEADKANGRLECAIQALALGVRHDGVITYSLDSDPWIEIAPHDYPTGLVGTTGTVTGQEIRDRINAET